MASEWADPKTIINIAIGIGTVIGTILSTKKTQEKHFEKSRAVGASRDSRVLARLDSIDTSIVGLSNRMDIVEKKLESDDGQTN